MAFTEVFPSIHIYIYTYTRQLFLFLPFASIYGAKKQRLWERTMEPCSVFFFPLRSSLAGLSASRFRQRLADKLELVGSGGYYAVFLTFFLLFSLFLLFWYLVAYTPVTNTVLFCEEMYCMCISPQHRERCFDSGNDERVAVRRWLYVEELKYQLKRTCRVLYVKK